MENPLIGRTSRHGIRLRTSLPFVAVNHRLAQNSSKPKVMEIRLVNHGTPRRHPEQPNINWRKLIWLGLILLVVGYIYAQPQLEQWLGFKLPDLADNPVAVSEPSDTRDLMVASPLRGDPSDWSTPSLSMPPSGFRLKPLGGNRFTSPAGLHYAMGPNQEHRLERIMRHSKDDLTRPVHGVFLGNREQILKTLDEAFALSRTPSTRVNAQPDDDHPSRVTFEVDLQKKIGYHGGRTGKEQGNPVLNKVMLVIENENQVIQAYPTR